MKQLLYISYLFIVGLSLGQVDSSYAADTSKYLSFYTPEDYQLELDKKKEVPKEFRKKKAKRKVFYGEKTKKGYTIKGLGKKQEVTIFYYLKTFEEPNAYVKDIYWFDLEKQKIIKSRKYDPLTSKILHGPYKKMVGEKVIERGIYYKGTKHGRWEKWKKPKIEKYKIDSAEMEKRGLEEPILEVERMELQSKEYWDRGWPKESEITYYDPQKTKIKEVKPIVDGKLHGEYYLYMRSGKIKTYGHYEYGDSTGQWVFYQDHPKHYKDKIVVYPRHAFSDEDPLVLKRWNKEGKVEEDNTKVYQDREREKRKKKYKR